MQDGVRALSREVSPTPMPGGGAPRPFDPALLDERVAWEERRAAGETPDPEWHSSAELAALFRGADHVETLLADLAPALESAVPSVPGFRFHTPLGVGGMGEVWLGDDLTLGRPVAIKLPLQRLAPGQLAARFEREGRALGRLRHPNIVAVHSAGVTAGRPYLVMDYVPGGSLEDVIDDLPADPRRAAALVADAADGVQHAHESGVFHRDLKPSNLFVDLAGRVRVGDFGIAAILAEPDPADPVRAGRPTDETVTEVARLTRADSIVGTPAYAAPEIHRAPAAPPGPESDVWSLGVILYRAVTGGLPFDGRPPAVRDAVLTADPPDPRAVNPHVPVWLDGVIRRCLAKDPVARFRTAGELAEALRAGPVAVRRRRRARERATLAAAALAALAVAILAVVPESRDRRHDRMSARIARDLAKATPVDLVAAGKMPLTWKAVVNRDLLSVKQTADGVVFDAHGPVFVELARETPPEGFRMEVVLRQTHLNDLSADAGVYVGGATAGPGVCDFLALRFSDLGTLAKAFPGPAGRFGAADQVQFVRHSADSPVKPVGDLASWTDFKFGLKQWRKPSADPHSILVDVQNDSARYEMDGLAFPTLPLSRVRTQFPAGNRLPAALSETGGVGLYLNQCSLLVKSARLSPLPLAK